MVNVLTGHKAEAAVAEVLKTRGYKILDMNWKTPRCEIDMIAKKDKAIYFVEVKYRLSQQQGSGFEYITAKKLDQIKFAAKIWCQQNDWDGDYRLLGAEVSGLNFEHIHLSELDV